MVTSDTQIKEWFKQFKDGCVSVDSDPYSGRPSTSKTTENVERVRFAINQNLCLTMRKLKDDLRIIPKTIVFRILTEDLGMSRVIATFITQILMKDQKNSRVEVAKKSWNPSTKILSCLKELL
ncbi:PREDICTED: putative uncharacterized protein FLJ37770 [Trachymyrmex septentrionalis]|uniref:putative uncharacterized protein FLJ37770 n=1 Tax=Trachymyrmex septentrionalis TaxID=34720 RepID=UPI00084F471A|nr:PREDICTED: putative uncharacterized protein FLJ37770 [Trachymyrmex septentrionalis]